MALTPVVLNVGSGGAGIQTDLIGGDSYEVVKQAFGSEGTATMVDAANPLPVTDAVANLALASIAAEDFATQTTLAALLAKVIAAPSTEAKQDAMLVLLTTIAAITQPLTDAQLRASPVPISGTVAITGGGDATAANQATGNASLASIDGKLTSPLAVTGTFFQATQPVSAASLPLPAGAATAANQQTNAITDAQIRATPLPVSNASLPLPTGASTAANQATGNASLANLDVALSTRLKPADTLTAVALNSDIRQATASNLNAQITGSVAHDGVDAGNPIKVGARAIAFGTNPTAVAAADRTDLYANRAGIQFVIGGHPNIVCFRATYTAAQTDTAIVTVAGGLKIVVTRCTVTASAANTVNPSVIIGFGAATTPTTTGVVLSHPGVAPGSGVVEGNGAGILGVGADNDDLRITCGVPTSGAIDVVVSYFSIES